MDMDDEHNVFQREYNYDVSSKIMLSAIITLLFVIILVTILFIYARCVLRRQAALSRLSFIIISSNATPAEPPKTGLDPEVIAALPVFVFKQINNNYIGGTITGGHDHQIECPVCLSMLEDGETARTLPNCKHTFHSYCIDKWFHSNSTCPVCRREAQPRLVAEPREGVVVTSSSKSNTSTAVGSSSTSRLSSFRRIILSIERSSSSSSSSTRNMQIQSCGQGQLEEYGMPDLERH